MVIPLHQKMRLIRKGKLKAKELFEIPEAGSTEATSQVSGFCVAHIRYTSLSVSSIFAVNFVGFSLSHAKPNHLVLFVACSRLTPSLLPEVAI